ncbi:MAG: DUF4214 domain-containing protein [Acidobacteria bacterium]|nr:DUF4214 domain-containing protein [Acidobacteriota bacterium]
MSTLFLLTQTAAGVPGSDRVAPQAIGRWSSSGPELGAEAMAVAVDPSRPHVVYAGTLRGVYKSTDSGLSWSPAREGLGELEVAALAIDPTNTNVIYAGTINNIGSPNSGVFKSTDAGGSWNVMNTGMRGTSINVLAVDPVNSNNVYAGTSFGAGIYKSTNGGASWNLASNGVGGPNSIYALVINPTNPQIVYAGVGLQLGRGVYKSIDGGANWVLSSRGLPPNDILALALDPIDTNTLYAGTMNGGIYKSTDAAANWQAANAGLPASAYVTSLAVVPAEPNVVYAALNFRGVFRSTDRGVNWNSFSDGLPDTFLGALATDPSGRSIYVGTGKGVFDYEFCNYSIYPMLRPFGAASGSGKMTVVTAGPCGWTAASNVPWLTITSGGSGNGVGRIGYSVAANVTTATRTGTISIGGQTFTITQTAAAATPTVQFSAPTYAVAENASSGVATITVTRNGDTVGAVTVEYATVDDPASVPCSPEQTTQRGIAYARCDYATTIDRLTFAPGETTKTFNVPLFNDTHVEGNEAFQVRLVRAQGATLSPLTGATVSITDDDTALAAPNPIFTVPFFVRQQYLDFLSREPEAGEPWSKVLTDCPNASNTNPNSSSAGCDRVAVSAAFFGSPESRLKGIFVFLLHRLSFNRLPEYEEFAAGLRQVTGGTGEELIAKRFDLVDEWVTHTAFRSLYDGLSNATFVDTLLGNVRATLATPDPISGVTRDSLVADLEARRKTRADVLRLIADSEEVGRLEYNNAFVAVQYYGYLRRKPEPSGYNAWLDAIGRRGESFRTMVNGFVNSTEYKLRFGRP